MFINKRFTAVLAVALFFISNQAMALISGQLLWERSSGTEKSRDFATNMKIDKNNNIYLAGVSDTSILTIKYDSKGNRRWARKYPTKGFQRTADIDVDDNGNVYVSGSLFVNSKREDDYSLIKYDSSGTFKWSRLFNGSANSQDEVSDIDVDSIGNIYITGSSRVDNSSVKLTTVKYSPEGIRRWTRRNDIDGNMDKSQKITIDSNDNLFIACYGDNIFWPKDFPPYVKSSTTVIKYDSSGNQKWVKLSKGRQGYYQVRDLEVDIQGNLIVAGEDSSDFSVIKYNQAGAKLWARYFGSSEEHLSDLTLDSKGNIYLAGDCLSHEGDKVEINFLTVKYDKDGNRRWARQLDGSGTYDDEGYGDYFDSVNAVTVGKNNAVYVTGITYGGIKRHFDFLTVKYDSTGKQRWARRYNGSKSYWDSAHDIKTDSSGNVFVLGTSNNNSIGYDPYSEAGSSDITLLKYAP